MPGKSAAAPSFEEALKRLEEIVSTLERGDASLEESIALFEEGTKLRKLCSAMLEAATARVRELTEEDGAAE